MKILNLFAGIGGNRTLWKNNHKITAVEHNKEIANIYKIRFPNDTIIIGDAYDYFEKVFHEFNVVWASPPCQSHTNLVHSIVGSRYKGKNFTCRIPDMRLYGLIIFLQHQFRGDWIVENVKPYYKPLIKPISLIGRHYIWSNKFILPMPKTKNMSFLSHGNFNDTIGSALEKKLISEDIYELLSKLKQIDKEQIVNNTMFPEEGKYILDRLIDKIQLKSKNIQDYFK